MLFFLRLGWLVKFKNSGRREPHGHPFHQSSHWRRNFLKKNILATTRQKPRAGCMRELYPMQTPEPNAVWGCNPQMAQQDTYALGTASQVVRTWGQNGAFLPDTPPLRCKTPENCLFVQSGNPVSKRSGHRCPVPLKS